MDGLSSGGTGIPAADADAAPVAAVDVNHAINDRRGIVTSFRLFSERRRWRRSWKG